MKKNVRKKLLSLIVCAALVFAVAVPAFADDVIPQRLTQIVEHKENGETYYEYQWVDKKGISTLSAIDNAEWVEHDVDGLTLRHRAAKEASTTTNSIRGLSQTDYPLRHYTRVQLINVALFNQVLSDSDRQYTNSGIVSAETGYVFNEWGVALRSYWG